MNVIYVVLFLYQGTERWVGKFDEKFDACKNATVATRKFKMDDIVIFASNDGLPRGRRVYCKEFREQLKADRITPLREHQESIFGPSVKHP